MRIPIKPPELEGFKEKTKMEKKITIGNQEIRIVEKSSGDYLSLTDLAKLVNEDSSKVISRWIGMLRSLDFLNVWEKDNNPNYNEVAYNELRMQAGVPSFFLSTKQWLEKTNGIGIESKAGRGGGTFAHHLIALEFCSTMSSEFRYNVFKEYTSLKQNEADSWLKTHEFYLQKIEENALENNRLSLDIQKRIKKIDKK